MLPCFSAENTCNGGFSNSKFFSYLPVTQFIADVSNFKDFQPSELGCANKLSPSTSTMNFHVVNIALRTVPTKIGEGVIEAISIVMTCLISSRSRPYKCFEHETMYAKQPFLSRIRSFIQCNKQVSGVESSFPFFPWASSAREYATIFCYSVAWPIWNGLMHMTKVTQ